MWGVVHAKTIHHKAVVSPPIPPPLPLRAHPYSFSHRSESKSINKRKEESLLSALCVNVFPPLPILPPLCRNSLTRCWRYRNNIRFSSFRFDGTFVPVLRVLRCSAASVNCAFVCVFHLLPISLHTRQLAVALHPLSPCVVSWRYSHSKPHSKPPFLTRHHMYHSFL